MSKKIVVKIEGKPYGEAGPLVGPNCTVYGRIRNTETDTWESDWIALPVSALDFDIEASSFAQARITVTVNSLKNIELALGEINVKKTFVDPERGKENHGQSVAAEG